MQLHQLKRKTKVKKPKSVGRGGKRGKTSGRGTKGQNARAGSRKRPETRDLIKKIPKLRGRGVNSNKSVKIKPKAVNLSDLENNFNDGEKVTPETLVEKKVARKNAGKNPPIKILADGEITKKVEISGCLMSAKAKEKIEKAGGSVSK